MGNVCQKCPQQEYFRCVKVLADFQKCSRKRLPLELRFHTQVQDHITFPTRISVGKELIARPVDGAHQSLFSLHRRPCFCKHVKFLSLDLGKACCFPTIHEKFDSRCSRFCRVIPTGERGYDNWTPQLWLFEIVYESHLRSSKCA